MDGQIRRYCTEAYSEFFYDYWPSQICSRARRYCRAIAAATVPTVLVFVVRPRMFHESKWNVKDFRIMIMNLDEDAESWMTYKNDMLIPDLIGIMASLNHTHTHTHTHGTHNTLRTNRKAIH